MGSVIRESKEEETLCIIIGRKLPYPLVNRTRIVVATSEPYIMPYQVACCD